MKPKFGTRRARSESHPLEATTVWKEYQRAKKHQAAKTTSSRLRVAGIALAVVAVVGILAAVILLRPAQPKEQTIPLDAKARSEFVDGQRAKLTEDEQRLLARFLARVQAQESAGGPVPKITVAAAIERQRAYDNEVGEAQKLIQERLEAARLILGVNLREQAVVKADKSPSGKSLRYVLEIANRSKRTIDAMGLRVDFRDPSGKYVAAIPTLELKGPLLAGETTRNVQMLPLAPKYHQYILDGGAVQISAYPTQISYADGEKVDAEQELKRLESLARAKIE